MLPFLFQIIIPFVLSAFVVVFITVIAEKYGTKIGGIVGTLPTTIVIAFVFIALNKGLQFASDSVAVVPAEMGINLLFLCVFAILAYRSTAIALTVSFIVWTVLSTILYLVHFENIYISLAIYTASMVFTFIILEKIRKIKSVGKEKIHYTATKMALRGVLAGTVIAISVFLSNLDPTLSGIFSIFPAIFTSTMIITVKEHGPDFSAGIAKSMILGSLSVMSYATCIHFLYPIYGIAWGSIVALCISVIISFVILKLRGKMI